MLAGTDYVYPRTTNKILEAYLKAKGVAAEDIMINYTPFGHSDWQTIVSDVKKFGSAGKKTAVVSTINGDDRDKLYEQLLAVAKKKTAEADVKLDDRGKPIVDEEEIELGDNCIIVPQTVPGLPAAAAEVAAEEADNEKPARGRKKKATKTPAIEKEAVEKKPAKKAAKRRK